MYTWPCKILSRLSYWIKMKWANAFRVGPIYINRTRHDDVIKWKHFPCYWPFVTRSFDVFFDLRLNKRLSKQSWGWWFETLSCPLWRHYNEIVCFYAFTYTPATIGARASSHYPKRSLSVRFLKVSKPQDWYFKLSYRFEIQQAIVRSLWNLTCCRSACRIS